MVTFVKAPETAGSNSLFVAMNKDVIFHTASVSSQATLDTITMGGFDDYELVWFGLAIAGNTSTITSTSFQTNIDNTGMTEAFSSIAQGVDWDLLVSKSQTKNNVPTTDSRLGAIIETDYFTFNFVTASTLSEAYKEIWTGGKLVNDPTDPNYSDYERSFSLDFLNGALGNDGHIYDSDDENVLFISFWGPGRYVREVAKRFKIRPTSNTTTEFILQACIRTETQDTQFSEISRLREITTGLPEPQGTTFFYNLGEDTEWVTSDHRDDETQMVEVLTPPNISFVQLSYPRPIIQDDTDDTTKFAFIYEGKKIITQAGVGTVNTTPTFSNNTADVAYDFATNKRYGLGEYFRNLNYTTSTTHEQTNFLRYAIRKAQIRGNEDLTITDSTGATSTQKRYTFNSVIFPDANKFDTLKLILNNMHGQYYFHNGYLKIYQDRPADVVKIVNQSNTSNMKFVGRNHQPDFNTCYVKYNNERKMFRQDIAFSELRDQLNTGMPVVSKQVVMQGITNKNQALRHAKFLLQNARTEKEYVEYECGADHVYSKPGDLIMVQSTPDDGQKHSGRIVRISNNEVIIDANIDLDTTKTYDVYIDNGVSTTYNTFRPYEQAMANDMIFHSTATVLQNNTNRLVLSSTAGLQDINQDNAQLIDYNGQVINIVEQSTTPTEAYQFAKIYRIQSIAETGPLQYKVVAQRYNYQKWQEIDKGFLTGVVFEEGLPEFYQEDV